MSKNSIYKKTETSQQQTRSEPIKNEHKSFIVRNRSFSKHFIGI